jgi:peptidyl-dipeptidase Dcp
VRKTVLALTATCIVLALIPGCAKKEKAVEAPAAPNPLLAEFTTPFGVPPFPEIKPAHFMPAFEKGIADHSAEIAAIAGRAEPPSFANTLEALDRSGALLKKVSAIFSNLNSSNTSDELQTIAKEVAPKLAKHDDDIALDAGLFARIKAVHDGRASLTLSPEQSRLLEETYKRFVRGGANLPPDKQARFRAINEDLAVLTVKFGENILKENNAFELVIDNEADLTGLPPAVVSAAAETAKERGKPGKWAFTLNKPSLIPFLQYSPKRGLRERMFTAYIMRGSITRPTPSRSPPSASSGLSSSATRRTPLTSSRRTWPRRRRP